MLIGTKAPPLGRTATASVDGLEHDVVFVHPGKLPPVDVCGRNGFCTLSSLRHQTPDPPNGREKSGLSHGSHNGPTRCTRKTFDRRSESTRRRPEYSRL